MDYIKVKTKSPQSRKTLYFKLKFLEHNHIYRKRQFNGLWITFNVLFVRKNIVYILLLLSLLLLSLLL